MTRIVDMSRSPHAVIDSLDLEEVSLTSGTLADRKRMNAEVSIPHQYDECVRTGRLDNFRRAAGELVDEYPDFLAPDSDVYKWMEAMAFELAGGANQGIRKMLDEVTGYVASAQEEDGYLDTSFNVEKEKRWESLTHAHELYCGGHLIQAAVAHARALGNDDLLEVATRWSDLVHERYGPGKMKGSAGHAEVEMALVELYRQTGKKDYLDVCIELTENRGQKPPVISGRPYFQDHVPIREQITPVGHAVRQMYLASGVTDIYAETGDESLLNTLNELWGNLTGKRMSITGGCGPRYDGEAFGADYELPNRTAYNETCSAIASFMWAWRMLQVTGEGRFADAMDRALHNSILSGISLEGRTYFYVNTLEYQSGDNLSMDSRGTNVRTSKHWDNVPCCPPNAARLLAAMPGYLYGKDSGGIYVHMFASSVARIPLGDEVVIIRQETNYPWDGTIALHIEGAPTTPFNIRMRLPEWTDGDYTLHINDEEVSASTKNGYLSLTGTWASGDILTLTLPMEVKVMSSHPRITDNTGKVALMRGPVVYCLEQEDNPDIDLYSLYLNDGVTAEYRPDLLGGVTILHGDGVVRSWSGDGNLYAPNTGETLKGDFELIFIPYQVWANRTPGEMRVWLPRA